MPRGKSGRIVLDIDPAAKRHIYAALALDGRTLKDWFLEAAQPLIAGDNGHNVRDVATNTGNPDVRPTAQGHRYCVVSMFSGCGGMDRGFKGGFTSLGQPYEALPYEIVWANDLSETACETYKANIQDPIRCGDIWKLIDSMPQQADVLVGGFPCQDISINGPQIGVNGKRSGLYRAMVEAVRKIRPRLFMAENVKNLLTHDDGASLNQVISDFRELGYSTTYKLYNTADYGVAQTRERVIIVGVAQNLPAFVPPLPVKTKETWVTARQALLDLEDRELDPAFNHIWSYAKKSPQQGSRRLVAERPSHTMRAECHGNIQYHYRLPRRMSMREAARVQSFPDDFIFKGGIRELERQVGNAVPPVFAWHLARAALPILTANLPRR
jgi:DNA (cytosine-5)-methyltransferase 1